MLFGKSYGKWIILSLLESYGKLPKGVSSTEAPMENHRS
jgi:hypothetical protein